MVREYLTARELEDLVARGVTQVPISDEIILTELARDRATALGVILVRIPKSKASANPEPDQPEHAPIRATASSVSAKSLGPKPSGCLHSCLPARSTREEGTQSREVSDSAHSGSVAMVLDSLPLGGAATPQSSLVERLVDAVRRIGSQSGRTVR